MQTATLRRILVFVAGLLILKVTAAVVLKYGNYLPPDFSSDFLRGRETYFWGGYRWAFYTHIATGPIALVLGLLLVSNWFRQRFAKWHRRLGRIQVLSVLVLVTPSGLWMALYAEAGPVAALGFSLLAILTAMCMALGWRSAVKRRFAEHRRWMWRGYLLLCSAVVIRLAGGLATVMGTQALWVDQLTPWLSWLAPLAAFELMDGVGLDRLRAAWAGLNRSRLLATLAMRTKHPHWPILVEGTSSSTEMIARRVASSVSADRK